MGRLKYGKGQMTPKKLASFVVIVVMIVCSILLIYYGLTVAKPYAFTSEFVPSQCRPVEVSQYGRQDCICTSTSAFGSSACLSNFPCVEVTVSYALAGGQGEWEAELRTSIAPDERTEQCVLRPCEKDHAENNRTVYDFLRTYGNTAANTTYNCLYNPSDMTQVVLDVTSQADVIRTMLWPSLVFVVCVIVMVVIQCVLSESQVGDQNYMP